MNNERVIGKNNKLPWHVPEDLAFFKEKTQGKVVIMGRKTFESIGKPLPNRTNVIISRQDLRINNTLVFKSLINAINFFKNEKEVIIIGGAEIFQLAIPLINSIYITYIDTPVVDADAWFPEMDLNSWLNIYCNKVVSKNNIQCSFNHFIKE